MCTILEPSREPLRRGGPWKCIEIFIRLQIMCPQCVSFCHLAGVVGALGNVLKYFFHSRASSMCTIFTSFPKMTCALWNLFPSGPPFLIVFLFKSAPCRWGQTLRSQARTSRAYSGSSALHRRIEK